jgi:hypothetical protein
MNRVYSRLITQKFDFSEKSNFFSDFFSEKSKSFRFIN